MASDPTVFTSLLRASLLHWKQQGKKGVWIKMPIELVNLVESAVKEGFYYHHAEAKYLMLVHWIPETANTLPANASHQVGIGAFVMNKKREPLSFDIQKQESEIEAAELIRNEWMSFDDYAAQPFVQTNELLKYLIDICSAKESGEYTGFTHVPTVTSFSNNKSNLYLNMRA
ncbi:hypothetical protein RJ639_026321 [Escallonia herrerae]|uniref:Pre-nudix hydrolase domain-containing protein n=1 Tax=Escallonia herrerae TaxID=1293975 RepID=A0AA88S3G9_9ASTE|nr:hypothetical protein RJ639_026321 [Escallonia herrerae]